MAGKLGMSALPTRMPAPPASTSAGDVSRTTSTMLQLSRVSSVVSSSGAPTITTSREFTDINNNAPLPSNTLVRIASKGKSVDLYDTVQPTSTLSRFYEWKGPALKYVGRYSVDKLLAFEEYQRVVSSMRVTAVLFLTPLPSLATVLLLAVIPLQSPLLSVEKNATYFIQSFLATAAMIFSFLLFIRCSLGWSPKLYSHKESTIVAVLSAICIELVMFGIAVVWRFPVPLDLFIRIPTSAVILVLFQALTLGSKLCHSRQQICRYLPLLCSELLVLIIFHALATLFMNVSSDVQVGLATLFPVIFVVLKRVIWSASHSLEDMSTDMTLCVVVIFGSISRMVCLQSVHSLEVGVLLVVLDTVHGLLEIWLYVGHKFIVDGQQTTRTAFKIVEGALFPGAVCSIDMLGNVKLRPRAFAFLGDALKGESVPVERPEREQKSATRLSAKKQKQKHIKRLSATVVVAFSQVGIATAPASELYVVPLACIDDVDIPHRENAKLLSQTLQLLFTSEMLIFAEYFELTGAVVYSIYSLALFNMPYARYSFNFIGVSTDEFWVSFGSTMVYAVLKLVSLLALRELVQAKYGLSTLYQLAFVLEKYWMSVQGKLLSTLLLTFILNTVHHGMDWSLKFHWEKILNGGTPEA